MDTSTLGVSPSDQGQKEAFLNELSQFLSDKGRSLCRSPNLAGRIIDLHDLYNKVTSAGGYQKVTERGFWEDFLDVYGYPAVSSTLAYGLQKIYQLYLEDYERVHYFGDDEPQPFFRSYPGGFRRYRYKISDMQRVQANMNMLKPCVSDYDRVVLSLESCLPNEVDFAVNACTLLSGESRHVLRLPQCRRIVDALLMHAGVVSDDHDSYYGVLEELQNKTSHDYRKFWNNSISLKSVLPILLPPCKNRHESNELDNGSRKHESRESPEREIESQTSSSAKFSDALQRRLQDIERNDFRDVPMDDGSPVARKSKWSELFHGHRSLGVEDYEGQRVLQIALVLLNLSFEDFNVALLARHPSLIRFVFLCVHSEYSCLRQTGLDILSNISSHMQLLHLQYDIMSMVFDTINTAVLSHDKFERIRGFEILGNVCRLRSNIDRISVYVCEDVYDSAIQNLMITDVEILVAAIEALYRLSKLGETACTKIIFVKGCVDILMCLVTLNVRTFGQEKLSEIRLARKIQPGQPEIATQQQMQAPSVYHAPTQQSVPHHNHAAMMQRQMQLQQQAKFGSAHQAQPTFAPAATIASQPVSASAIPQSKLPSSQTSSYMSASVNAQPKIEPSPTPPLAPQVQVKQQTALPPQPHSAPSQQPPPAQPAPPIVSSPPPSAAPPTQVGSSPPGAGPTYTHSETGTVPPVFHYMPAPPTDIVKDGSPDSFTKLWIWATYEAQSESYIPRVDVYCEYLASSNRYGRQGKTEILSATDFGKCLKQIFPHASSRLFNQGRGQPQYHIAGIKKRATPLPVPGHQLKDVHSVFSSDSDQVAVTVAPPAVTVSSKTRPSTSTTPRPNLSSPASPTAVPIQQLQFQPILIVSAVPGSSNVALVSSGQLATTPAVFNTSNQTAVALQQHSVTAVNTATAQVVSVDQNLKSSGSDVVASTVVNVSNVQHPSTLEVQGTEEKAVFSTTDEQEKAPCGSDSSSQSLDTPAVTAITESGVLPKQNPVMAMSSNSSAEVLPAKQTEPTVDTKGQIVSTPQSLSVTSHSEQASDCAASTTGQDGTKSVVQGNGQCVEAHANCLEAKNNASKEIPILDSEKDSLPVPKIDSGKDVGLSSNQMEFLGNGVKNSVEDKGTDECNHHRTSNVTNGYMEVDPLKDSNSGEPVKEVLSAPTGKESDKLPSEQTKKHHKRRRTKSKDTKQLVNGITEDTCEKDSISDVKTAKNNGLNGEVLSDCSEENRNPNRETETEAAVNSILDPSDTSVDDIMKMDVSDVVISPSSQQGQDLETKVPGVEEEEEALCCNTRPSDQDLNSKSESTGTKDSAVPNFSHDTSCVSQSDATVISNCITRTVPVSTLPISIVSTCVSMTPTNQTQSQVQMTPTNPIPHSALNQRLKDTITRRKNSQLTPSSTPSSSLPPSVIQQYSYKLHDGQSLAQQIIPITPQQLQQQYHQQRQAPMTNHPEQSYQGAQHLAGNKRIAVTTTPVPPAKIQRPTQPLPVYSVNPSYTTQYHTQQHHSSSTRPQLPTAAHRLPHPRITQQHHVPPRPSTPITNNPSNTGTQPKPKPPTIDLMADNASLLVLYRNVGKIPFANYMDEKEDAISKSVRLTAALILTNIARYSNLGRSLLQKHEDSLARVAMSQMDCSPIVARLLSELDV